MFGTIFGVQYDKIWVQATENLGPYLGSHLGRTFIMQPQFCIRLCRSLCHKCVNGAPIAAPIVFGRKCVSEAPLGATFGAHLDNAAPVVFGSQVCQLMNINGHL